MEININRTVSFTGYRPLKTPWGYNENDERCLKMKQKTKEIIEDKINNGYDTFICGMALGFDMIVAEIILNLKKQYPFIKLIGAIPCKNQSEKWNANQKIRYDKILRQLDYIYCKHDFYTDKECMLERNRFMIDNSSLVIALYDGKAGGTKQTVSYAKSKGLQIIIITP